MLVIRPVRSSVVLLWCLLFTLLIVEHVNGFLFAPTAWTSRATTPRRCIKVQHSPLIISNRNIPMYFRTSGNDLLEQSSHDADVDILDDLGDEEEEEEDDEEDVIDEVYDSKILALMSKTVIPLSISIGFAVVPSGKLALRFAGATAGGVVGLAARSAIRTYARKPIVHINDGRFSDDGSGGSFIPDSVAGTIRQLSVSPVGLLGQSVLTIERTAKQNEVHEKELGLLFTLIFSQAAFDATAARGMDLTQLTDVLRFANVLRLTEAEVGDGLALAATRLGKSLARDERGFYKHDFPVDVLNQASKLLFLADKLIGVEQGYYGRRMAPALSFYMMEEYKHALTEAGKEIFRQCVEGVLIEPNNYQRGEIDDLKNFLTVSPSVSELRPAVMQHMIYEAIQFMLNRTIPIDAPPMTAAVQNYDKYIAAQPILGWDSSEWVAALEARTMPIFEASVRSLFTQVMETPERASELAVVLKDRVDALKIDPVKARVFVTALMGEYNRVYMNNIDRVYNASGGAVEPSYKIMVSYAHTHAALKILAEPVMQGAELPLPGLPFTDVVRANIYQAQLSRTSSNGSGSSGIGNTDNETIRGVHADMFALSPEQRQVVRKHLALPKLVSWVKQCIAEGNFSPQARAAYSRQLNTYGVTNQEWSATAVDFYYQEALKVSEGRVVPAQEEMSRLADLGTFLDCAPATIEKVHLELFAQKYIKALTESMTPTGVITDEYVEGLRRMRQRLGLGEHYAEVLFAIAARERIGPVVRDLVDIWKSDTDANHRAEKNKKKSDDDRKNNNDYEVGDKSRDPISSPDNVFGFMESQRGAQKEGGGPNVFMREALNLVDFLTENHKLLDSTVSAQQLDNLKVSANGVVSTEELTGMFKHYVITRLTEQDPVLAKRYNVVEGVFGKVLGISEEGQRRAKESLAYSAYKHLLMRMLQNGEVIGAQLTAQFVYLMEQMNLNEEVTDRVLREATKGAMIEHTAKIVRATAEGKLLTPADARCLRNQIDSLGLDFRSDVGFSDAFITYLYALEVQLAVESGEGQQELADLMISYGIPPERAEEIVEATCKRHVSQLLNLALRAAKKYDERDTLRWVINILQYAPYISTAVDADGNLFDEADKDRLIAFYQAEAESAEDAQLIELTTRIGDVKAKLRELIRLTEDFVAPQQGIEGLLGNVKSLAQLGTEMNVDSGRKTWAWG